MKKIEKYTFIERIYSLLSCLSFIIVLFIPDGNYLNLNVSLLIFTSLLSHGSSLFFPSYTLIEYIFSKLDHICILVLALRFFRCNIYINSILFLLSVLSEKCKNIIIIILFFVSIIMIYNYDIFLSIYVLLIVIISLYYYSSLKQGWTFKNSWCWHLLVLHYFISIKILQLYIDNDKFK